MEHPQTDRGHGHQNKPDTVVIINGRPKKLDDDQISYSEVVQLAFPRSSEDILYSITFTGPNMADGTLADGQILTIKNGMKFDVTKTNRS